MSGHTPGPWSVVNGHLIRVTPTNDPSSICGVHRRGIHGPMYNPAEVLANAYLIAASPDLLTSITDIMHEYRHIMGDDTGEILAAYAAILKASPPKALAKAAP